MKSENKKILILLIVILGVVGLLVLLGLQGSKKNEEIYLNFEAAFTKEEPTLIYIGRPTCTYCQLLEPSLQEMKERYNFDYIYINTDEFSSNYLSQVMAKLGIQEVATPYLTVVNKDGIVDTQSGYVDYDILFKFLQENKIIDESAELVLNYIDYEQYEKLLKSDEETIVVIGQSTCYYCVNGKLALNEIVDEYDIEVNYLNISYLTEEQGQKFEASLDYFKENTSWGTPVIFIVKDGEVVDYVEGFSTKQVYVDFFKESGVINE